MVDVACGRKMSHFDGILISVDGRFCGTRTQEGGWVGLAPGKGVGWVVSDVQEAATILAQDLGSCEREDEGLKFGRSLKNKG